MFKSQTVIIVGAGASAEFGVPTGRKVYSEASSLQHRKYNERISGFSFQRGFEEFLKGYNHNQLWAKFDEFKTRVDNAANLSIDRLAWLNTDIADICKAFSAWCIVRSLYTEKQEQFTDYGRKMVKMTYHRNRNHLAPLVGEYQNWIAKCTDKWLGQAKDWSELDPNILTFVTFNYDTIIEEVFRHFVSENTRFRETPNDRLPAVLHVHGGFPQCPEIMPEGFLWKSQLCINYIEEGGNSEAIRRAKIRLADAKHIISVGFDFDPQNVELLQLSRYARKIHALNYDGNEAFDNRVLNLGVPQKHILSGTFENKLGVSAAAERGFFDRPELFGSNYSLANA
tara:strand:+ start:698 stop:1717 length:1020 start_codon:yes stop_codon:yes gene_type:complete